MSEFLSSVKADLLGVRLRLVMMLLAIGLLAAVAYVVLGGKTSSTPAVSTAAVPGSTHAGIAISTSPVNPNIVAAETTNGSAHQRSETPRNPFTPLPGTGATGAAGAGAGASSKTAASSTTKSSPQSGSTTSAAGGTPVAAPKPVAQPKTQVTIHYHVTAQFGVIPAAPEGTQESQAKPATLQTFTDMPLDQPLPNKTNTQLVFLGVVLRTGRDAVFGLTGEAILHGSAVCLPSATQCQSLELEPGQAETLESIEPDGTPVTYELRLISILKSESSATTSSVGASPHAHSASSSAVQAGRDALSRKGGVTALSGLEYSPTQGVLVFTGNPVLVAARARAAARRAHHGR